MHSYILVKIKGTSAADAEETLKNEYLENYCGDGKSFDYYGDCTLITKDNIDIVETDCKTLKSLEDFFINLAKNEHANILKRIKEDLLNMHYNKYMSIEEAPTFINSDISNTAKDLLSGERTPTPYTMPTTPSGMVEDIVSLLAINVYNFSYKLKQLQELSTLVDDPTDYGTAFTSLESSYVDLTSCTEGNKTYYFWCDRHC